MQWIKASERLPEKAGLYTVRAKTAGIVGGQAYFNEKRFEFRQGVSDNEIEWLDECESKSAKEIERLREDELWLKLLSIAMVYFPDREREFYEKEISEAYNEAKQQFTLTIKPKALTNK